jgi:hypothetical protein
MSLASFGSTPTRRSLLFMLLAHDMLAAASVKVV